MLWGCVPTVRMHSYTSWLEHAGFQNKWASFWQSGSNPKTKCLDPLLCLANVHTKTHSQVSVALHTLFILIPSKKAPLLVCCLLEFCTLCAGCRSGMVYPVNALPCERKGRLWDLSVIRPMPHGHHMWGMFSILKVPLISVACKKLQWNELFYVTLHTPKHSITVAIVHDAMMLLLISVLLLNYKLRNKARKEQNLVGLF